MKASTTSNAAVEQRAGLKHFPSVELFTIKKTMTKPLRGKARGYRAPRPGLLSNATRIGFGCHVFFISFGI